MASQINTPAEPVQSWTWRTVMNRYLSAFLGRYMVMIVYSYLQTKIYFNIMPISIEDVQDVFGMIG